VSEYKKIAEKMYPDWIKVESLKPLIEKVDQDDPYWKSIIKVAKTDTNFSLMLTEESL
jgi:hypothetical protein